MADRYKNGTYLNNNPSWHEEDSQWKAKNIFKIIQNNSLAPTKICEIGCGAGEILNQLSQFFPDARLYGYEISPHAFEICKKKAKPNLTFKLIDLLEENEQFDILLAIDVFEHVEDYLGFLRGLKEKADFKIFHVPLDLSVQSVFRSSPIIKIRKSVGHLHYFTKETALETLRDSGYEIIDYAYTATCIELPTNGWKADLMRMPRKFAFSLNKDLAVRILGGYSLLVLAR